MGWVLKLRPEGDVRSYNVTSASIKTVTNVQRKHLTHVEFMARELTASKQEMSKFERL